MQNVTHPLKLVLISTQELNLLLLYLHMQILYLQLVFQQMNNLISHDSLPQMYLQPLILVRLPDALKTEKEALNDAREI